MPTTKPLNASGTVTLNGSGAGVVDILVPTLQTWDITRIGVLVSSNTREPTAKVYVDSEGPGNFLAGTYTGSNDSSDENQRLMPGQHLLCRWTGGDAGAQATMSVFGTVTS
jgi:hypothetical protein